MTHDNKTNGPSRLDKHLDILGLGNGAIGEGDLAGERRLMADLAPKRLRFPLAPERRPAFSPSMRWLWTGAGGLAAAAAVVFMIRTRGDHEPGYQVKGGNSVQVVVEDHGAVHLWAEGMPLSTGAKVKAQIAATEPTVAFWGVASRDHRLLSERTWIWQNRLTLAAGDKKYFAGSLELEGASEGEALVVVMCPAAGVGGVGEGEMTAQVGDLIAAGGEAPAGAGAVAGCKTRAFPLRP